MSLIIFTKLNKKLFFSVEYFIYLVLEIKTNKTISFYWTGCFKDFINLCLKYIKDRLFTGTQKYTKIE